MKTSKPSLNFDSGNSRQYEDNGDSDASALGAGNSTSGFVFVDPRAMTIGISTVVDARQPSLISSIGAVSSEAQNGGGDQNTGSGLIAMDITHDMVIPECGCPSCVGFMGSKFDAPKEFDPTGANPDSGPLGELLVMGTNPDGSRFFSGNRNVDAALIGSRWTATNLTFSFPTSGSNYNGISYDTNGVSLYHIDLGTAQANAARAGFAAIQAATGLTLTEITDTDTVHANFRISQTADQDAPSAYGNFPSNTRGVAGDMWFGRTNQPYYDTAFRGTWGYSTMLHEIGHAMGLKHGHQDYTNVDLSFYFGTTPRFGSQSLTPDRDGQAWSLMTYTPSPGTSGFAGEKINQPQTYMQYDLAALQYMYGANFTTNNTDTTYTFSETTGEMFVNGVGQGAPAGNRIFLTIWDGGGNDTINASNYNNGVTIDLRPGEFSTVDSAQLANTLAYQNLTALAPGNIAMSLLYNNDTRSLIENATGGNGNDMFVGNTANNLLDGGAGSDTVVFTGTTGISVTLNDTNIDVVVSHDGETDTLRSIENIVGTAGNDTLIGNAQNNALFGSLGGTDILTGNDGDDRLVGGGFTTVNSAIITKQGTTANISTATAVDPQVANAYTLLSDANITNSTTTPHATINATAAGGGLEYYRVDATAGATAIFDIDGSSIDTWIELVDSTGTTVLAQNDDSVADAGSGANNSYLTYTFTTAGTYYIRVGRWTAPADTVAQPLAAGSAYTLHISLSSATVNTSPLSAVNTSSATLDGGNGNDLLVGTLGNDTINGGADNDTASFINAFSNTAAGVTVDLNTQGVSQNTIAAGTDTLTGIENLIGSQYADTLTGDGNDNLLEGGLGNDTIVGGGGLDTASYAGASAGVTVSLALQGAAQNTVNAGSDTLSGMWNLLGSAFNDTLTGDANGNRIRGGAGDDILNPGANPGSFAGPIDVLEGGQGSDTASFAGYATGVTVSMTPFGFGDASTGGNQIALFESIENVTGSSNADVINGNGDDNIIEGGLGDDVMDGGLGNDTVRFTGATAITLNLATLTPQATGYGTDTIINFENVRTGSGGDSITGDGNDNIFFDGGGNDTYDGAGGNDTINYSASTSTVTVDLNTATASRGTFGGTDTLTGMENVVGALLFTNALTGNTVANRLTGGNVADTIIGNNGNDVIFGGAGNDILLGGTNGALDDASSDTLEGGAGNDFMSGGQGNDILRGGDGDDTLIGGISNTSQFFTNDGGDDTYEGGNGFDTAIVVLGDRAGIGPSTVGAALDLRTLEGNSAITFNGVNVGSMTSIERITFRGSAVNDVVGGTGGADSLTGLGGDDTLDGWYGNDVLSGGLGNDTLIGGEGLDTVTYVNSLVGVNVDLRIVGVAQDTVGEGIDTLTGIEYLTGSAYGDSLRGDDDFNLIIDTGVGVGATALSQTDSLFGYGGNDSMFATRVTAAVATNINFDGGDGADMIELRSGTLSSSLLANAQGLSTATYLALGATSTDRNLDVVTVDAGAGDDRIVLTGVASATINAGSGADIVSISMRGVTTVNNYNITLGTGADIIQFGGISAEVATTARTNRVTDFGRGDTGDKFEMSAYLNGGLTGYTANSNAFASGHMRLLQSGSDLLLQVDRDGAGATNGFVTIFALSNGYTGAFTAFNFDGFIGNLTLTGIGVLDETLTGATGNDVLSGGDGIDRLIGLDGNDTLNGGNGNDILRGGNGTDTLDGGAGADLMKGNAGDDNYVVDDAGDLVGEAPGEGTDTVSSSINYELTADVENLILTGTAQKGSGNELNNIITGNGAANRLYGLDGADRLNGGGGNDKLWGGDGADIFAFGTSAGQDIINDFVSGTDRLDLTVYGFADFAAVQAATTDVGGNAVIDLGGGNSITLTGVLEAQLQAGDVILTGGGPAIVEPQSEPIVGDPADMPSWFAAGDTGSASSNIVVAQDYFHRVGPHPSLALDYMIA
jgi:Ca2+-binding RTX toxin-like protein